MDLVLEFYQYYQAMGKKVGKPYYHLLRNFEAWLASRGKTILTFTPADVELYYHELFQQAPRSANLFLTAVRKFVEWRVKNAYSDVEFLRLERLLWNLKSIRQKKVPREITRASLEPEEIKRLIDVCFARGRIPLAVATVVNFYFGWRPHESTVNFASAKIFWDENYMIIRTAKTGDERILPWADEMTPYVKLWYNIVKGVVMKTSYPSEWYTKNIKPIAQALGMTVTAKTARKTFETQMRRRGVEQWAINFLLGHTTQVPDIYTDWTALRHFLSKIMSEEHYLLPVVKEVSGRWMRRVARR